MRSKLTIFLIAVLIIIPLIVLGCKTQDTTGLEERIAELEGKLTEAETEVTEEEITEVEEEVVEEEPAEDTADTEEMEEEDMGEEPDDADADTDTNTDVDDADKEAPTISLAIYEGPALDGSICYYRVEATVTGSPTVSFSKDDSGGAWGSKKVQININDPTDTYTLTATATNSEGSATDSIALSWGCAVPAPDPIETDVIIGIDINESGFTVIGEGTYLGVPLAYLGDWDNDKNVLTYLIFDINSISTLDDVTLKDVSVTIPVVGKVNQPEQISTEIIVLAEGQNVKTLYASASLNNLNFSSINLKSELQKAVDADKQRFELVIGFPGVLANGMKDYYRIHVFSAALHIKYEVPG